jgi:hypothetical protein
MEEAWSQGSNGGESEPAQPMREARLGVGGNEIAQSPAPLDSCGATNGPRQLIPSVVMLRKKTEKKKVNLLEV